MTDHELLKIAKEAMQNAYAPYSHFSVGAALECADGQVITGCNVENGSLGLTICAERAAVAAAVSRGYRHFTRIAVWADSRDYAMPCGACRQVLSEFAPSLEVLCARGDGRYVSYRLRDLLPEAFRLGSQDDEAL